MDHPAQVVDGGVAAAGEWVGAQGAVGGVQVIGLGGQLGVQGGGVDAQFGFAPGPGDGVGVGGGDAGFEHGAVVEAGDEGVELDVHRGFEVFAEGFFDGGGEVEVKAHGGVGVFSGWRPGCVRPGGRARRCGGR